MIYLIITTSINNKYGIIDYENRKNRYLECIKSALNLIENMDIKPIIVENNGVANTYLDELKCDVIHTDNNSLKFIHKGINELADIKHIISLYNIGDDDIIMKLTGRYKMLNNSFIKLELSNMNNYDAFVKFFNVCTLKYMDNDCILGLFAVKCKYLKQFYYKGKRKSPEVEFATHIRRTIQKNRIMEVIDLNLECVFSDNLRVLNC